MLSLPAVVESRPANAPYAPQPANESAPKELQPAAGSKQNTSKASEWNVGSFRTFGDVLSAHLQDTQLHDAPASPVPSTKQIQNANTNTPTSKPTEPVQTTAQLNSPLNTATVQNSSPGYNPAVQTFSQLISPQTAGISVQPEKTQNLTEDSIPSMPAGKMAFVNNSSTHPASAAQFPHESSVLASQSSHQFSANEVNAVLNSGVSLPLANPDEGQLNSVQTATYARDVQGVTGTAAPRMTAQDAPARNPAGLIAQNTDTEVFRIDLHPSSAPLAGGDSGDAAQYVPPTQTTTAAKLPAFNATQDKSASLPAASAVSVDSSAPAKRSAGNANTQTKSISPADQEQPAVKSQTAGSGTENPDSEALKQFPAQQQAVSLPAVRASNPGNDAPAGTRFAQSGEPVDTTRPLSANQVSVRMEGDAGQVINVRFVNQGDQVQVAVRSNDPSTTAQLRQGLNSLTDNLDRVGWKADIAALSGHSIAASHDAARSDSDPQQGSYKGSGLDWEQGPPKKRSQAPELWEEMQDLQDA